MTTLTTNPIYGGAWPAVVTPFDENLKIDVGAYRSLIDWYSRQGAGGLYANCLTSEMYQLTADERVLLTAEAVKASAGRVPVAATGNAGAVNAKDPSQETTLAECREIAAAGADVLMLVIPPWCLTDDDVEAYFMAVAGSIPSRLGIYECPAPRPYHLGVELVYRLAHTGRFYAFKETSCQWTKILALIDAVKGTPLALLQANTPYLLDAVRAGAPGTMSIAATWLPDLVARVVSAGQDGDSTADALQTELVTLELAQRSVHPRGTKYLLGKRGVPITPRARVGVELSEEERRALDTMAVRLPANFAASR
jgi:4-hydroxy-tetrahydrodipicolinate synthase